MLRDLRPAIYVNNSALDAELETVSAYFGSGQFGLEHRIDFRVRAVDCRRCWRRWLRLGKSRHGEQAEKKEEED
jgi:hypothetical protein